MTEIKLRMPSNCGAIVHAGQAVPIGADGAVLADPALAVTLRAHGAVPWADGEEGDPATMDRAALVELFVARTRAAVERQDTETIRAALLAGSDEDETDMADAPAPDPTRDEIAAMGRSAVTGFLHAKEVAVPAGATLAELRTRAVEALGA